MWCDIRNKHITGLPVSLYAKQRISTRVHYKVDHIVSCRAKLASIILHQATVEEKILSRAKVEDAVYCRAKLKDSSYSSSQCR